MSMAPTDVSRKGLPGAAATTAAASATSAREAAAATAEPGGASAEPKPDERSPIASALGPEPRSPVGLIQ